MSVIAVVEPHWWGHHPTFTKLIVDTLLMQGHEVLCACGDPGEVGNHIQASAGKDTAETANYCRLLFHDMVGAWPRYLLHPPIYRRGRFWAESSRALKQLERESGKAIDLVFFVTLDPFINAPLDGTDVDRLFPFPWVGLVLFPTWLHGSPGRPPSPLRSSRFRGLYLLDETMTATASLLTGKPSWSFPDVTDVTPPPPNHASPLLAKISSFCDGKPLIGLVGTTDRRKGIFDFLSVAKLTNAADLRFLVCGDVSTSAQNRELAAFEKQLRKAHVRNVLHIRQRLHDGIEFNSVIQRLSLLWTAYPHFPFSSNLLTKASFFRVPVAANVGGLIARRVTDYDLGVVLPAQDAEKSLSVIRAFLHRQEIREPRYSDYFQLHSTDRAYQQLAKLQSLVDDK